MTSAWGEENGKNKLKFRNLQFIILVAWFIACLIPISNDDGISINYIFVFTPIIFLIYGYKLVRIPNLLAFYLIFLISIYISSLISNDYPNKLFLRQLISFMVFISVLILTPFRIDNFISRAFYLAIILISLLLSCISIFNQITYGSYVGVEEAKVLVGSQRTGFIYLFAIGILLNEFDGSKINFAKKVIYSLSILIIMTGVIFTYSRTAIISFGFALLFYCFNKLPLIKHISISNVILIFLGLLMSIILLNTFDLNVLHFYNTGVIEMVLNGELSQRAKAENTSEGIRMQVWSLILDFSLLQLHPLTGNGFLGIWALDNTIGSAESQYFDVLFRIGILGFFFYAYLLYRIYNLLYQTKSPLLFGFVGSLIYGIFHETFKESHGAFIFSFLLACLASSINVQTQKGLSKLERV